MGIFSKPKLKSNERRDSNEGDWIKCPGCNEMHHNVDIKSNFQVCPKCEHHFLLGGKERVALISDEGSFVELNAKTKALNPLDFTGYDDKLVMLKSKTNLDEGVLTGKININGKPAVIAVMDFKFFAGSMGSVVGEKLTRAIEAATADKCPIIIFSASSGARMQEGMFSLMQMAKTCSALARHAKAKLPYFSIMTHPTTGGVTASFATVGDLNFAEPGCMIGFAGPRVVKVTTHQNLPPGFQTAEFMLEHGLIDAIVTRHELKSKLSQAMVYLA